MIHDHGSESLGTTRTGHSGRLLLVIGGPTASVGSQPWQISTQID